MPRKRFVRFRWERQLSWLCCKHEHFLTICSSRCCLARTRSVLSSMRGYFARGGLRHRRLQERLLAVLSTQLPGAVAKFGCCSCRRRRPRRSLSRCGSLCSLRCSLRRILQTSSPHATGLGLSEEDSCVHYSMIAELVLIKSDQMTIKARLVWSESVS